MPEKEKALLVRIFQKEDKESNVGQRRSDQDCTDTSNLDVPTERFSQNTY